MIDEIILKRLFDFRPWSVVVTDLSDKSRPRDAFCAERPEHFRIIDIDKALCTFEAFNIIWSYSGADTIVEESPDLLSIDITAPSGRRWNHTWKAQPKR